MSEYNLRTLSTDSFAITKFDDDFNVESSYEVSRTECTCPQGSKPTCRHRKMLPQFLVTKRQDSQWFLNYETGEWSKHLFGLDPLLAEDASIPADSEQPEAVPPHSPPPAPMPEITAETITVFPQCPKPFVRRI